ncbi:unnamed protein product [Microthlaspi erraticum]|uniref:Uncharacterized protein n=1 Tax=Microthlaspi erraticum TaxID=1685480 RepID=A0A6D2HD67_9BRAS|nr:unnamed protein product [Microthlaspi erraticum]
MFQRDQISSWNFLSTGRRTRLSRPRLLVRGLGYENLDKLERISCGMMTRLTGDMPTLTSMQARCEAEPNEVVSLTVFVQDRKVICAASGPDTVPGRLDNFCTSMKTLFSTGDVVCTCMLPLEYSFQKSLLGSSDPERTPNDLSGFVNRWPTYMILDDLTIKSVNSTSAACFLMELDVRLQEDFKLVCSESVLFSFPIV